MMRPPEGTVYSPLVEAVIRNDVYAVKDILQRGGNAREEFEKQPFEVWSVLGAAAAQGYTQIALLLMAHGADVNEAEATGVTPLMFAAWNGRPETVQASIDSGAEIDAQSRSGTTALMLSITGCKIESTRVLINNGASLHLRDTRGNTALCFAKDYNDPKTVRLMEDAPEIQRRIAAEAHAAAEAPILAHNFAVKRQGQLKSRIPKSVVIRELRP